MVSVWLSFSLLSPLKSMAQNGQVQLPDGDGKQAVLKVCGNCHGLEVVVAGRRTASAWQQVVGEMVARGATGTDAELQAVTGYLATNFGPTNGPQESATPTPGIAQVGRGGRGGRGSAAAEAAGAAPKDITSFSAFDMAAVPRGAEVFSTQCASCHGADARGGKGLTEVDLILSPLVLDDVRGEKLSEFLKVGRPEKNMPKFDLTQAQVSDLAQWMHYTISKDTLRGYYVKPNVFSGDSKAGEAFFNGSVGKCNTCHSVTGDLKGVAAKYNHDNPSILSAIVAGGGGGRGGPGRGGEVVRAHRLQLLLRQQRR